MEYSEYFEKLKSMKLEPNKKVVVVKQSNGFKYYYVERVYAYIEKCIIDKKEAHFAGETDEDGKIIN